MDKVRINQFLKYLGQIAKENPNIDFYDKKIADGFIRSQLIRLEISDKDKKFDTRKELFPYWVNYFKNRPGMKVFVDPNWNSFCQFCNGSVYAKDNHIKVYIPIGSKHLKDAATDIFEFLRINGIKHHSKIANSIRFDNIVIRLDEIHDLQKLLSFLKANKNIQKNLIKPNPFAFSFENVAIVSDGKSAYNSVICQLIRLYILRKKQQNSLNLIDDNDFFNFVYECYNRIFIQKNAQELYNNFEIDENSPKYILDIKSIFELIIASSNDSFSIQDYLQFFKKITSPSYLEQAPNIFSHTSNTNITLTPATILEVNQLLLEAFRTMITKYQSKNEAMNRLYSLLVKKQYSCITNDNGLRSKLINAQFQEKLKALLDQKGISLNDYLTSLIKNEQIHNIDINHLDELLRDYVRIMSQKYSREQAILNLSSYLKNGSTSLITNDGNLRKSICLSSFKEDLLYLMNSKNMTMEELFTYIEQKYAITEQTK